MNQQHRIGARILTSSSLGLALGVTLLTGCSGGGGGGGGGGPKPHASAQSTATGSPVSVLERFIAYLADESTTTDPTTMMLQHYNLDADSLDLVPAVTNMATKKTTILPVAADDLTMVRTVANGTHLFFVTDEAKDSFDWNMDMDTTDIVLLHYDVDLGGPIDYVADLDTTGATKLVTLDDRVYFADVPPMALMNGETTICYVDTTAPTVPVRVLDTDMGMPHHPQLMGADEGLIFLYQDENVEGVNLNGGDLVDMDMTDGFVLALLDGTDPAGVIQSVGLAMRDAAAPFRANMTGPGDWVVAFLVDETAQGPTNFNDESLPAFGPAWRPLQCAGFEDMDTLDNVLHYIQFKDWWLDPVTNPPVNTGLVGSDRVLAVQSSMMDFVGVVSAEADEGTCDLNGDGMLDDEVLRWVKVDTVVRPFGNENELVSLERTPGGTEGVTDLDYRFLCVVDEADDGRDHDGDMMMDRFLIAWLDPADGNAATWDFDHCKDASNPVCNGVINSVGTLWMGERMERDFVLAGYQESVYGASINDPVFRSKGGDKDLLDSVPTFGRFAGSPLELDFPGPRVAVDDDNLGVVIVDGRAYYRVDEAADNTDWNGDKDKNDFVLFRTDAASVTNSFFVGTLNSLNAPAVVGGSEVGVAFVTDESEDGKDLNKDGDANDFVLQWLGI